MLLVLGAAVGGLALVLVLRALLYDRLQGEAIVERIGSYTGVASDDGDQELPSGLDRLANLVGARFGQAFDQDEARRQIMTAGLYSLSPQRLIGYRLLAAAGPPLLWLMLGVSSHANPMLVIGGLVLASVGGFRLPVMYLERKAKARLTEIDHALPGLVDLMVVTIEAGVSLGSSLRIGAERLHGPLRDELRLTLKEQQMGLSPSEAMKHMQERCPTPAMAAFVRSLSQTEQLGVSLGKIMRDLADDMRKRRKASAEERANKAPVKMLFPLVFLIFPSMLVILLGPAVLQLLKTFSHQ